MLVNEWNYLCTMGMDKIATESIHSFYTLSFYEPNRIEEYFLFYLMQHIGNEFQRLHNGS